VTVNLADQALDSGLVQPDLTTCGSSVLVVAHMFSDPSYAAFVVNGSSRVAGGATGTVQSRFKQAALAMHRLTGGFRSPSGGFQLPWPSALGTQPWSLAREMAMLTGRTYQVQAISPGQRSRTFSRVASLARKGVLVPLFVGSRWLPRHVVLALPSDDLPSDQLMIYDPASGRRYPITAADFAAGRLDVAGWSVPWAAITPA
jgi:hypothetical protein